VPSWRATANTACGWRRRRSVFTYGVGLRLPHVMRTARTKTFCLGRGLKSVFFRWNKNPQKSRFFLKNAMFQTRTKSRFMISSSCPGFSFKLVRLFVQVFMGLTLGFLSNLRAGAQLTHSVRGGRQRCKLKVNFNFFKDFFSLNRSLSCCCCYSEFFLILIISWIDIGLRWNL
jgi:hypothetical protein